MRPLIALLLLLAVPAAAKPTVVNLTWEEFQGMTEHLKFRRKVTVFTGKDGRDRIRMRLERVSASGITLSKNSLRTLAKREDVHSVRISPRYGNPLKWRLIASAAAFPLWLVGITLGLSIPGGIPEGRWHSNRNTLQGVIVGFGLPAAVYVLAQRADKRNGAIIIELEQRTESPK